jgi:hypothetical protein
VSLVTNERIKLTAGLLNTVAGFALTAGGIGPLIALSYGVNAGPRLAPLLVGLIGAIWLIVGVGLHIVARFILGRLQP